MTRITEKNSCRGIGEITLERLIPPEQTNGKYPLYAKVTIPAGSSCGYHTHTGDCETYYILSGEAVYDDNGVKRIVKAGDVTFTPDGSSHGMDNTAGKEDLVFMALIIKS